MKIYISLPINTEGYDINLQRKNAKKWQLHLESQGYSVSNPFEIYDRLCQFHKDTHRKQPTRLEIMTADLKELIKNDVIFFCNGWSESEGCIEEAELAMVCDMKVMFEKDIKL